MSLTSLMQENIILNRYFSIGTNINNWQMGPLEAKQFLHGNEHCHSDKVAEYNIGKYFYNPEGSYPKIYKECKKFNIKKTSNSV